MLLKRGLVAARRAPVNIQGLRVSDDLDLVRGLAAIAVLIYHVRTRCFYDYADVRNPDLLCKLFYGLTSFGHDAVVVFFVLSGYFVSASVLRDGAKGRWSWTRYAISRLTRLYLVLLPGLLLTLFWDHLGLWLFGSHPIYTGAAQSWISGTFSVAKYLGAGTFAANLLFLQDVTAPTLGSNVALWSLSYEFWYYVMFPCAWFAMVWRTRWTKSIVGIAVFAAALWFVGKQIVLYFPIWLLGTAVCLLPLIDRWKHAHRPWVTAAALALFGGVLCAVHTNMWKAQVGESQLAIDYALGISFALVLYFLIHNQSPAKDDRYAALSRTAAGFSYTLYLTHMPLLVFVRAAWRPASPWQPDLPHEALAVALSVLCLVYAYVVSRLTEARTSSVRRFFMQRFAPTART